MSWITIAGVVAKALQPIIEKEIKETQSRAITEHNNNGFVVGASIVIKKGPQKGKTGVIEQVKHLWLIVRNERGRAFRVLVNSCEVL